MSDYRYDLHTHSTASDGILRPKDLVARADEAGIGVLAITDHDTTDGVPEAVKESVGRRVRLVPGAEISVTWRSRTVHIVALQIDPDTKILQEGLLGIRDFRSWRAEEIARRLEKHGISGTLEGVRKLTNGSLISRTHFARILVSLGYAATVREVFNRFLVLNKPGYVSGQWGSIEDVLGWIMAAGGMAVIAHPARYRLTATKLRELLGEFRECGGVGIEVISGRNSRDETMMMARYAHAFRLRASVGSDFHGHETPSLRLGTLQDLPEGCTPIWEGWGE